jgi:hypothetical protein
MIRLASSTLYATSFVRGGYILTIFSTNSCHTIYTTRPGAEPLIFSLAKIQVLLSKVTIKILFLLVNTSTEKLQTSYPLSCTILARLPVGM